ncbi:hypothetical protein ACWDWT_30655 [Streptomyces sp. NPDC003343]
MGSNLRRQLREALPPSIKGLQRAVALEIADDARYDDDWNYNPEKGRRSKVRLADLVRWTAAKDELSVREMLRRLSLAGWEFRLPIGKDKNGNLLYAVPGKAMTFRVPDFEGPTTVGPYVEVESEGPTTVGPEDSEGPTVSGEGPTTVAEGPTTVGEGPTVVGAGPTTVGPPSPISSPSPKESPSSSSVAGDVAVVTETDTTAEEGGGGGEDSSSEEQDKPIARAVAFVESLDYRGKPPGQLRRTTLQMRVVTAFQAGWTEHGLRRYLDISDDPKVRNPAAVYEHRLSADEIPAAAEAETVVGQLPPACASCLKSAPESAHNVLLRRNYLDPIGGGPCPRCHPDSVGQSPTQLPPACETCLDYSPGAATNVRLRTDHLSFHGGPCPRCHPTKVPGDWRWPGMDVPDRSAAPVYGQVTGARARSRTAAEYESSSVDDLFGRAMERAQRRMATGDWKGASTDERVAGWAALARELTREERINAGPGGYQPYRNPTDQSVYDQDFGSAPELDQSAYDEPL